MSLICDNFAHCNSSVLLEITEDRARAAGWHLWSGETMGGKWAEVRLCPKCAGRHSRPDAHLPPLQPGDSTMIQVEIEFEE